MVRGYPNAKRTVDSCSNLDAEDIAPVLGRIALTVRTLDNTSPLPDGDKEIYW